MKKVFVEELISLVTRAGVTLHAYLICPPNEEQELGAAATDQIYLAAERQQLPYFPVILQTRLTTGGDTVREVLAQNDEATASARKAIDGSEKYHFSIFAVRTGCPEDISLMELH